MGLLSVEPNPRITFKVRHEDADLLVVGKPAGVVTTPGLGHERDSLLNGLFARHGPRLQKLGKARDFGLLHRLDRETSGLVLCALTVEAYEALREAFTSRQVEKYYWAVVFQAPKSPKGLIRRAILEYDGKAPGDPRTKKLARISPAGKPALTAYRTLAESMAGALLECRAVTGRLHQVRVHLDSIGCPILGDDFYGPHSARGASRRLALHAHRLVFKHPTSGERIDVRSPWPSDLRALLKRLHLPRPDLLGTDPAGADAGAPSARVERAEEIDGEPVGDEEA
ncbi:MAG: RluA family pseudouridine synthase [Planctomycetota bacterium]|nr:RluA family pseudouridine synthase [Planctomycetota bacterium]